MCGIAGSYDLNKVERIEHINSMLIWQHNRGPDNRGVKTVDQVTFAHNRLSIIGLSSLGDQPMKTDRYMIAYNGECYNYKEITPLAINDTEAVLHSIHNKGLSKTLDSMNGMFAFGLYDNKEQEIHLVVDRFAQKPLYYYHTGNKFYFASTPAALTELEPSWEINQEALQSYWLLGGIMGSDSIFKGIKRLTASEHLTYSIITNSIKIERYWEPKFQDKTDNIEDLVFEAINKVKVSDVPIHIFLSGGIDSTLVASQFKNGNAIHLEGEETDYAKYVANKFNINFKKVSPQTIQTETYLMDYARQCGEPAISSLTPYTVAKYVNSIGGKVAISANAFDELFFGYTRTKQDKTDQSHIYRLAFLGEYEKPFETEGKWYCGGRWEELMAYIQFDLNKTLDFASMCSSVEVRTPALDHRLVEMALSIHEKEHRINGDKSILKRMLHKLGFDKSFTGRRKIGFSADIDFGFLLKKAVNWCLSEGWLKSDPNFMNGRDRIYTERAALSFYYWHKTWQHKLR